MGHLGLFLVLAAGAARASEYHGTVSFHGIPVPGATVTATQGTKTVSVTTDALGNYRFADLADGTWTIAVKMSCFEPAGGVVTVAAGAVPGKWELAMQPVDAMLAAAVKVKAAAPAPALEAHAETPAKPGAKKSAEASAPAVKAPAAAEDAGPRPSDGFLINGSVANAATSAYSLASAFGNTRSSRNLYTGSFAVRLDDSALDAKPYSITGLNTPKPFYNNFTAAVTFGGPLNIKKLMPKGPNFFVAYEWTRDRADEALSGLVPTLAQRASVTPVNASEQAAQDLLALFPLPNLAGSTLYNYQTNALSSTHVDALQTRLDRGIGRKDQVYGNFSFEDVRSNGASLFGFVDTTDTFGLDTNVSWQHRFGPRLYATATYKFSKLRTHVIPQFEGRQNVSGADGIAGNLQDAADWGPPNLVFSSISSLTDAESAFNRNETNAVGESVSWTRSRHNMTFGGDFGRREFNVFSQQNPRGTFTFTGANAGLAAAPGADVAQFLSGTPTTSQLAYGNPDKYLRQSTYDLFANDDWRLRPELTINAGIRWEYGAPETERKNRLVNLDVGPGFTSATAVLASAPVGPVTGLHYPSSLVRPDKSGFEPRVALSWRPIAGSTLVVRAGYGIYDDTSVYGATALAMAQQAPLSTSLSVSNSATCPLTLANGFLQCSGTTADTFAVDPNLRVGYVQTWQLSAQRDLPYALVGTVTYLGNKGTRGTQEFLPNTYPIGSTVTTTGPVGYVYRGSNGDSTRESGVVQLRRRLRAGFTATVEYTYSKSVDDDSLLGGSGGVAGGVSSGSSSSGSSGAATVAQNWLNLRGERGPSTFDQRNLLTVQAQYTSGQGLGAGTLMSGWRGRLLKEWTVLTNITAGSGLPETPIYLAAVPGTGVTGTIRPNLTGTSVYAGAAGLHLNPAAYTAPAAGQWGTAGRDSIVGPGVFKLNASLSRTVRLKDKWNLDMRFDSTNLLNHVTYTGWNTVVNGSTFGEPVAANAMRSVQFNARLRY
jgi:hypothetical protein